MDVISADWIRARLTGRHGEKAALARAMGIDSEKLSRILKGERGITAEEAAMAAAHFSDIAPGLREETAVFRGQAVAAPLDLDLARVLVPRVRRPMMFRTTAPVNALRIATGDCLLIDQDDKGDGIVVATLWEASGHAVTVVYRRIGTHLISTDPDDPEPMITIDQSPRVGIIGRIAAVYRRT